MKRFFLLFVLLLPIGNVFSQINSDWLHLDETYGCVIKDKSSNKILSKSNPVNYATLDLTYTLGGMYVIFMVESLTVDMIQGVCFSYGTYVQKKNRLILKDAIHQYKIELRKDGDTLICISGPNWLLNKKMGKEYPAPKFYNLYNDEDYVINISQLKKTNSEKYKKSFDLAYGMYQAKNFYFEIHPKGYTFYYNKLPLLQGSWKRKGSDLLLHTSTIPWTFSMLITKEGLVSQLLPGDFEGLLFKKID